MREICPVCEGWQGQWTRLDSGVLHWQRCCICGGAGLIANERLYEMKDVKLLQEHYPAGLPVGIEPNEEE